MAALPAQTWQYSPPRLDLQAKETDLPSDTRPMPLEMPCDSSPSGRPPDYRTPSADPGRCLPSLLALAANALSNCSPAEATMAICRSSSEVAADAGRPSTAPCPSRSSSLELRVRVAAPWRRIGFAPTYASPSPDRSYSSCARRRDPCIGFAAWQSIARAVIQAATITSRSTQARTGPPLQCG